MVPSHVAASYRGGGARKRAHRVSILGHFGLAQLYLVWNQTTGDEATARYVAAHLVVRPGSFPTSIPKTRSACSPRRLPHTRR